MKTVRTTRCLTCLYKVPLISKYRKPNNVSVLGAIIPKGIIRKAKTRQRSHMEENLIFIIYII